VRAVRLVDVPDDGRIERSALDPWRRRPARGAARLRLGVSPFPESMDLTSVVAPVVMWAGRSAVQGPSVGRTAVPGAGMPMGVWLAGRGLVNAPVVAS